MDTSSDQKNIMVKVPYFRQDLFYISYLLQCVTQDFQKQSQMQCR